MKERKTVKLEKPKTPETAKPGDLKDCPTCGGAATNITPLKVHPLEAAVFACKACGYTFRHDGVDINMDIDQLQDVFKGATMANKTILDVFGAGTLSPATRAMLVAKLMEYGTQMWFDGLKQGLLLGCIQQEKEKKDGK